MARVRRRPKMPPAGRLVCVPCGRAAWATGPRGVRHDAPHGRRGARGRAAVADSQGPAGCGQSPTVSGGQSPTVVRVPQ